MTSQTPEQAQPSLSHQAPNQPHHQVPVPAPMSAVDQRVAMAEMAAISQQKSTGIAYLFWFFLGAFGAHKFYLGRTGMGIAYLFTLGFLGIGLLIDLFTLPSQTRQANIVRRAEVRTAMGV